MMDWVHCNICFVLASDGKARFNLTSCGHIFCDTCINKNTEKKCKTCGQNYAGVIPLTNQLKPDVQLYFTDVKDVCKNAVKQIQKAQQVSEFQKGHAKRLAAYRNNQLSKATTMMSQAKELERNYRIVLHENETLKKFIASQGYNLNDILRSHNVSYPPTPNKPMTPGCPSPVTPGVISQNFNAHISSQSPMQASPRGGMYRTPGGVGGGTQTLGEKLSLNNPSPRGMVRNSNMVVPGRISVRTPPVNGKLGPINSPSPQGISPRVNQSRAPYYRNATSKIGQRLNASATSSRAHTPSPRGGVPSSEEKRPLQLSHQYSMQRKKS